ncbi:hypothetical protein E6C67_05215 [Azospirillum sp. TSA2s]|nr:hypothetical protein E6C67_05215 [Azospirillum sp. TSA2s]
MLISRSSVDGPADLADGAGAGAGAGAGSGAGAGEAGAAVSTGPAAAPSPSCCWLTLPSPKAKFSALLKLFTMKGASMMVKPGSGCTGGWRLAASGWPLLKPAR